MFLLSSWLTLPMTALNEARQARIDLMRDFFPQILTWRLARIQSSLIDLGKIPALYSRTFIDAMSERHGDAGGVTALVDTPTAKKPSSRRTAPTQKS